MLAGSLQPDCPDINTKDVSIPYTWLGSYFCLYICLLCLIPIRYFPADGLCCFFHPPPTPGVKEHQERFRWNTRKNFFVEKVVRC